MSRPFHLKPFSLSHHRSSMKVGMDSLLLGCWVEAKDTSRILDVGTGCGILALMMAAKSGALIDAVELDPQSAAEAAENFNRSAFHRRLKLIEDDFVHLASAGEGKYDLIISNPPFFFNDHPSASAQKRRARHDETLTFAQLASGSHDLLTEQGRLCLVLPYEAVKTFRRTAEACGLFLQKQMTIFPFRGHKPNRVNLEFGKQKTDSPTSTLFVIREENRQFTSQYNAFFSGLLLGRAYTQDAVTHG